MKFVGPMNSAQMHCSQKNESTITAEKKKKKKNWGNADAALISAIQTSTKLLNKKRKGHNAKHLMAYYYKTFSKVFFLNICYKKLLTVWPLSIKPNSKHLCIYGNIK